MNGCRRLITAKPLARTIVRAFVALSLMMLPVTTASAQGRDFSNQDILEKNFTGQTLDGANFSGASIVHSRFFQASLRGATFQAADIRGGSSFSEADLTGADFRGVTSFNFIADKANFTRANFEGVDFNRFGGTNLNFRDANLSKSRGMGICGPCNFRGADLRGANLLGLSQHPNNNFTDAVYDNATRWPTWADPDALRARRVD